MSRLTNRLESLENAIKDIANFSQAKVEDFADLKVAQANAILLHNAADNFLGHVKGIDKNRLKDKEYLEFVLSEKILPALHGFYSLTTIK